MKSPALVSTKLQLESLISKLNDYGQRKNKIRLVEADDVTTPAPTAAQPITTAPIEPTAVAPVAEPLAPTDESASVENVILQLNSIRAGKSLKDEAVKTEISRYFDGLEQSEKEALYSYLKGISQIVSGQIDAGAANEPKDHGIETSKTGKKTRSIKPNVIRGSSTKPEPVAAAPVAQSTPVPVQTQTASKENTAAPAPIVPKKR